VIGIVGLLAIAPKFGLLFNFIYLIDFPISLALYLLGEAPSPWLALGWVFVAGTLWWYLLSRIAIALYNRFSHRKKAQTFGSTPD
jgi:hypothetical protein